MFLTSQTSTDRGGTGKQCTSTDVSLQHVWTFGPMSFGTFCSSSTYTCRLLGTHNPAVHSHDCAAYASSISSASPVLSIVLSALHSTHSWTPHDWGWCCHAVLYCTVSMHIAPSPILQLKHLGSSVSPAADSCTCTCTLALCCRSVPASYQSPLLITTL